MSAACAGTLACSSVVPPPAPPFPAAEQATEFATPPPPEPPKSAEKQTEFTNPVLPGFYPDPSICRVGDDYYLVTSSFEYFPGVPVFHSKDLVHWRQIGHALSRVSQLPLTGLKSSQGIFAATIRHIRGLFYVVTTNVGNGGSFYVSAQDPAGPWSDPVWLNEKVWSMDPSLFLDDDGKVYFTRHGEGEHGAAFQHEIDLASGKLTPEKPVKIWPGTGGVWPEGPHLYKKNGFYYLIISEGGTGYHHQVTVARAKSPWGPFESHPANPILTHRFLPEHPIQATGHADLVTTPEGKWFAVLLGIRPSIGKFHHLGRETYLAPVTWEDGWPVINGGKPIAEKMSAVGLPEPHPWSMPGTRTDFDEPLSFEWNYIRNPDSNAYSLEERPGHLRLKGTQHSLNDVASPTFVGRRQRVYSTTVSTLVSFVPKQAGQEAGLVVRSSEDNHYDLVVQKDRKGRIVVLRTKAIDDQKVPVVKVQRQVAVGAGPLELSISSSRTDWEFFVKEENKEPVSLGKALALPFSSEHRVEFTGTYYGLYATAGKTGEMPPADFDWFEYVEN